MYVVNTCTVTPVRQEPSEGSEQLTQLLFGEVCEVLDRLPRWTKVRSQVDGDFMQNNIKNEFLKAKRALFDKVYGARLNPEQCRAVFTT